MTSLAPITIVATAIWIAELMILYLSSAYYLIYALILVSATWDESQHVNSELGSSVATVGQHPGKTITHGVHTKNEEGVCHAPYHSLKHKGGVTRSVNAGAGERITENMDGSASHQSEGGLISCVCLYSSPYCVSAYWELTAVNSTVT